MRQGGQLAAAFRGLQTQVMEVLAVYQVAVLDTLAGQVLLF
jgi:hypothetical protein